MLSREQQDVPALNGHLDAEKVRLLMRAMAPPEMVDHAFVCGPQPMIEGLEKTLADLGLPRDRIHVERFTPGVGGRPRAAAVPQAAAPHAVATVISEGVRSDIPWLLARRSSTPRSAPGATCPTPARAACAAPAAPDCWKDR